jgi:hypothetical protein
MAVAPVRPKPGDLAALSVLLAAPVLGFLLAFSGLGFGIPVYRALASQSDLGSALFSAAFLLGLGMYLLDAEGWDGAFDRKLWASKLSPLTPAANRRATFLADLKPLNKLRKALVGVAAGLVLGGVACKVSHLPPERATSHDQPTTTNRPQPADHNQPTTTNLSTTSQPHAIPTN